ncbi:baseplate J/gp47 family protein [Rhizobium lusitanum]|uniref:baseplate J/gp47 family protein n=1 Tax=Rhizobium lusitanum TaxID=293958 RepID=UPI001956CFB3|nr:baseplate J/gp47 family protein [Rhizobium lusitanum]MBM7045453.1 baseplate J/gp47 family protein [Rhizobium lusitanum]
MATLNIKSFTTLVRDQATAIQSKANALLDFTIGSTLRSIVESNGGIGLWLQSLILQVLALTRAATSFGSDLDTWVADYGLTRLASTAAVGSVTYSRFTPTTSALIPIGSRVQTSDFTQTFVVTVDTSNPAYSATSGGYIIPATVSSVTVPVAAQNASSGSNVQPNTVSVILDSIIGVDTVNNSAAFTGGTDGESDGALRVRFVDYLASLARGTVAAIKFAISNVQLGIVSSILENVDHSLNVQRGNLTIIVDDGTGSPPSSLLTSVYQAVDAYRAAGITFAVFAPSIVSANVSAIVGVKSGYDVNSVKGAVGQVVTDYINTLGIGVTLSYTRLAQVIYDASPGVASVSSLTLNSGTADLVPTAVQVIKSGTVAID